jgi:hypothetical protein
MHEPKPPGKVTVFELLAMIIFISPIAMGLIEGKKLGFRPAVTGFSLGLILGLAAAVGYRVSLHFVVKWMTPYFESLPNEPKTWLEYAGVFAGIIFFTALVASAFAFAIFAGCACRLAVHRIAA